jgi:spermidine/putrescine-binding protein
VRVKVAINAYQALPAGRTVLGQVWSGDMLNAAISYLPRNLGPEVLSYTYQREGGPVFNDCIAVAAAATKPVLAHRFMDFMLEPRNALENFADYVGYQPPLTAISAESLIADEVIPRNLESTIVTREAYANGNGFLTLTAAGQRRWDRGWARFQAG